MIRKIKEKNLKRMRKNHSKNSDPADLKKNKIHHHTKEVSSKTCENLSTHRIFFT